jgi:hypothetical protein
MIAFYFQSPVIHSILFSIGRDCVHCKKNTDIAIDAASLSDLFSPLESISESSTENKQNTNTGPKKKTTTKTSKAGKDSGR